MTTTSRDLAARAQELAAKSDGLTRRAALCVALACACRTSVAGAHEYLDDIDLPDVRRASHALLTELAERDAITEEP